MKRVNQSIAIIRPKRNFMKWANANSQNDREVSFEYFLEEYSLALLMPYYDPLKRNQAKRYVNFVCDMIFEKQLWRWNSDEETWPKDRGQKTFNQWFTVEFVYDVIE